MVKPQRQVDDHALGHPLLERFQKVLVQYFSSEGSMPWQEGRGGRSFCQPLFRATQLFLKSIDCSVFEEVKQILQKLVGVEADGCVKCCVG